MTELDAMYAAVKQSPQESTLRLAYADCLDEHNRHVDAAHQRILATPESDELRLAFADECEVEANRLENGEFLILPESKLGQTIQLARVRAEFVRVQVALAKCTVKQRPVNPKSGDNRKWHRYAMNLYTENARSFRKFEALSLREREILGEHAMKLTCLHADEFIFTVDDYNLYRIACPGPPDSMPWRMRVSTRRGFVDSVVIDVQQWLEHSWQLLEVHPITKVKIPSWPAWRKDAGKDLQQCWPRIKFTY